MEKFISLEIKRDSTKDDIASRIIMKGYNPSKPMQNTLEFIGLLEFIKQQEILKLLKEEVKD